MSASLLSNTLLERPPVTQPKKDYVPDGDYIPKICIVGYGRHGKDEAALALHRTGKKFGWNFFGSTSWGALPMMAEKLGLPQQIAWEERHKNRNFWKSHLDFLRRDDPCLLIRTVLAHGNICSGIRDKVEVLAAIEESLFDAVLWIERPGFPEDPTVTFTRADLPGCETILNDGTLEEFQAKVVQWACGKGVLWVGHKLR